MKPTSARPPTGGGGGARAAAAAAPHHHSMPSGGIVLRVVVMLLACCGVWVVLTALLMSGCEPSAAAGAGGGGAQAAALQLGESAAASSVSSAARTVRVGASANADAGHAKLELLLERARQLLALSADGRKPVSDSFDASLRELALSIALAIVEDHMHQREGGDAALASAPAAAAVGLRGGAALAAPAKAAVAIPPPPPPPPAPPVNQADMDEAVYTKQTCYVQSDESELCVYDGTFCFDGLSPIVVVSHPVREPERINDFTHSCMDPRFYEPSSLEDGGCAYMNSGERKSFNTSRWPPTPAVDTPMSLRLRRWGPINRNGMLFFKEVQAHEVWGDQPTHVFADAADLDPAFLGDDSGPSADPKLQTRDTLVDRFGPWEPLSTPGLRFRRRTRTGNVTVDWIDGALWVAGIDGQWFSNPYHWFSKIGALFDSLRSNATRGFGAHPADGFPQISRSGAFGSRASTVAHPALGDLGGGINNDLSVPKTLHNPHNELRWSVGSQWDLPPMDFLLFAGDGSFPLESKAVLKDWFRSTLELAVQPHTKYFFNDALQLLSPTHLVCATKGVIPGGKNKLFTGRSDAWLFRQYAYQLAGLHVKGIAPHPKYPPRKITVIDRKGMNGRGIYNRDLLLQLVAATGVPFQFVSNIASMSFNEQVALMASTGILIAPHGAAIANSMFLPAHGVVIEMFPYLMKKNTYRYLAGLLDLHYYPIYSWELLPRNFTQFYGVELMNEMYFYENCVATNITSYDALNYHACNAASKNCPILVSETEMRATLRDAVDTIGAYSRKNPLWEAEFKDKGYAEPTVPSWVVSTRKGH